MNDLFNRLGEQKIREVITEFYKRAFEDVMIGHFFFNKDREKLTAMQIDFAVNLLGGPKRYKGRPLDVVHSEFSIRPAHFDRRQVLLKEVLDEMGIEKIYRDEWLILEDKLRKLIVMVKEACLSTRDHASNQ